MKVLASPWLPRWLLTHTLSHELVDRYNANDSTRYRKSKRKQVIPHRHDLSYSEQAIECMTTH